MTNAIDARTRGVRFGRVLRAELLKATTVPAPLVTAAATVAFAVIFVGAIAVGVSLGPVDGVAPRDLVIDQFGHRPSLAVLPILFMSSHLLVALLAILLVSAERGTNLLRATLAAVPRRTPVLVAKLLLSGAVGLGLGLLYSLAYLVLLHPAFTSLGFGGSLWTPVGLQVVVGGAISLSLLSMFATAMASLFRSTASAAGAVLGLLIVAPVFLPIIPVVGNAVSSVLPASAASVMPRPFDVAGWGTVVTGALLLLGWTAVASVIAWRAWKSRDV